MSVGQIDKPLISTQSALTNVSRESEWETRTWLSLCEAAESCGIVQESCEYKIGLTEFRGDIYQLFLHSAARETKSNAG